MELPPDRFCAGEALPAAPVVACGARGGATGSAGEPVAPADPPARSGAPGSTSVRTAGGPPPARARRAAVATCASAGAVQAPVVGADPGVRSGKRKRAARWPMTCQHEEDATST